MKRTNRFGILGYSNLVSVHVCTLKYPTQLASKFQLLVLNTSAPPKLLEEGSSGGMRNLMVSRFIDDCSDEDTDDESDSIEDEFSDEEESNESNSKDHNCKVRPV